MELQEKNVLRTIKEYILITLGIIIYTCGWTIFLTPNNMFGGGVSGISAIIQFATGIKMGYTYFVINALLLVISLFIIGPSFGVKTVYAIFLASFCLNIEQTIIPQPFIQDFALSNGKLLCSLIGGAMAGLGIGMSISQGGSTGGTDIIALVYTKFRNVSPGRVILVIDVVIIASSIFFPSYIKTEDGMQLMPLADKITTIVYGLVLVTVNSYVMDLYISGSQQSVQLFILSKNYKQIADAIVKELHRGVTVLEGKGWYTQHPTEVLMVVTRKSDLNLMLRYIKALDSEAFLSVSSVSGVYGKGFDTIKLKKPVKSE